MECVLFEEMVDEGVKVYHECKGREKTDREAMEAAFLAMQGVYAIMVMQPHGTVQ